VHLNLGRSVTGSLSTSTPNVTLDSPYTFTQADVGARISGTGIYPGDSISTVSSSTTANLTSTYQLTGEPSEALTINVRLTSPVYDLASGNVFVGDTAGYLYAVNSTTGSFTSSANLGDVIIDAPLVDSSAGMVYAFVTTNNDTTGYNAVFQFYTTTGTTIGTFTSGSSGNNGANGIEVGAGGAGYYLYAGDFDNVYYQSSTPAGNLYVVGNTGVTTGATLYQIHINSDGTMGTVASPVTALAPNATSAYPWPSPLTEFCNNGTSPCGVGGGATFPGTDYLFFSVNRGAVGACTITSGNGCVLSYDITNPSSISSTPSGSLNVKNVGSPGCWATSSIVIDNSDTGPGASQVYFINFNGNNAGGPYDFGSGSPVTSGECATGSSGFIEAMQASQAALK
jgi:hypothetical protein